MFEPNRRTIGDLLSMTTPPIIVPEWQRDYSWTTSEVETFWFDLLAFSARFPDANIQGQEYFLGSVVLVRQNVAHQLLDGQQRAATATILLSVIREYLRDFKADAATRVNQRYITDYDDATDQTTYKLTLNRYDRDFFRLAIQDQRCNKQEPSPELKSHELILKARQFFTERFREQYAAMDGGQAAFQWALRIQKVLTDHMSVVAVTSDDYDNAASVFETLNDRGIGLSTPDLLRNLLIRRARDEDRNEVIECWLQVLEVDEEARVQDFLRHYWLSRHGDVKTRRLYREIKDYVEGNSVDSLELSRDLRVAAVKYRDLVAARHNDNGIAELLGDLQALGAKALLPAVMSAGDVGSTAEFRELLDALVTFFVRHNVIGKLENSRLETVIFRLARNLREVEDFQAAHIALSEPLPPLDRFQMQFASVSVARQKTARYLLRRLELERRGTEEIDIASPNRVHLEHIYPRSPEDGRWPGHNQVIHRLGNLTLLSRKLNQSIKNGSFEKKRQAYKTSELMDTRDLAALREWNAEAIDHRQTSFSMRAREIWRLPREEQYSG